MPEPKRHGATQRLIYAFDLIDGDVEGFDRDTML
jgi:hypothetical protein